MKGVLLRQAEPPAAATTFSASRKKDGQLHTQPEVCRAVRLGLRSLTNGIYQRKATSQRQSRANERKVGPESG